MTMILFFADNHFGSHNGKHLADRLQLEEELRFYEDDPSSLPEQLGDPDLRLLVLSWISETPGVPHPGPEVEEALHAYLRSGRPLFLFHGASAAFWRWSWWREMVGLRWVRGDDPDGFEASTHPVRPYHVEVAKTRHPLAGQLQPFSLPKDEIYIHLEQTSPITVLLTTKIEEGTFPQAYLTQTPYGGALGGFLPGHGAHAFESPELVHNVEVMIRYLAGGGEGPAP